MGSLVRIQSGSQMPRTIVRGILVGERPKLALSRGPTKMPAHAIAGAEALGKHLPQGSPQVIQFEAADQ
ncbi:hypothetical protein D3H65_12655 [Paraflavitalea soli]|uniref:Uncharacterized protein n=1 Tax=Paraflavitalea soli TaxID=2315862 RepID=A0A3B7MK01_9BACT|nr:hypothetical protein D3H65_12655 [Paraflavitalea soli]